MLLAALLLWHFARPGRESPSAAAPAHATRVGPMPAGHAAAPSPAIEPYPNGGGSGLATDDPLTAYKKANVYPPTSRPLGPENVDLLYPNRMHEQVRPTDANDGVTFLFTADRYYVVGDGEITASLAVRAGDAAEPVTITQAFAADPKAPETKLPLTFAPDGLVLAARFAPSALHVERQAPIGIFVELAYRGKTQRASLMFEYTPTAAIPATFTGAFHDAIEAGSLAIHTGVAVTRAGHYVIDANLFDAQNRPVAWTRWKGDLAEGTQDAPLVFFGKVIRDADAHGPYHLGQLRGARFDPSKDPDLEQMPPYAGAFATGDYDPSQFSGDEYDSDQKRRMIEFLAQQQAAGVHQGAAGRGGDRGGGGPTDDK